ncbi:LacI family DNA-binding transcriptional regulator [Microbispora sp. ATCC PTA-5024]|uniref:LacI family DNA-binding transcriptional regulator n=1 Tax=Microbispora sp. ATCC PTA-5024 TaxID=316330 RepID=UPI0003DCC50B|nr:LacI family DNA-binding transcriptional regulator [Microbispora sp. ATCC PTA-5024]ETK36761.1 LacI family transcriptional regulator [Microbispora sp. ATCC PTA-5024]
MNIGEIARRSGVARSTVSYALSGKRPVSEETRRRIQAVIDELGYRPNAVAKALKEGRTHTIGLVIPPASRRLTDMQLGFVASVVDAAARADLDVLLSPSGGEHDRSFERVVAGRRVDGVIVMEIRLEDERVTRLRQSGLPFVGIGRTRHPEEMSWVDIDYETLMAKCVHHLADLGHRQIALVNRSAELVAAGYGPGHRAQTGFTRAVAERGLHGVEMCCADDINSGVSCVEQLLDEHPGLTAIATVNESATPGVYRALSNAGLVVPRDFSIAGVAAGHLAENLHPPLTAADVPADELGARAVEMLIRRIADPATSHGHFLVAPPISLRGTTGPARPRGPLA